jgi:hypothetical protein
MSNARMSDRLDVLERKAPRGRGAVHVRILPRGLFDAAYDARQAERMRHVPAGPRPLLVRLVSPGAGR